MEAKRAPFDVAGLTTAERIQLAEDLWDSIEPASPELALTPAQAAELDRRLEELRNRPGAGESWETVREELHA